MRNDFRAQGCPSVAHQSNTASSRCQTRCMCWRSHINMTLHCEAGHADTCCGYSVEAHHEQGRIKFGLNDVKDKELSTSYVHSLRWLDAIIL